GRSRLLRRAVRHLLLLFATSRNTSVLKDTMPEQETITLTSTPNAGAPPVAFTIPRQLGSVRLVREIGRGGMGVVWLGQDDLLSRDVAVKLLLNAVAGKEDPGFVRFIEGARAAAAVRHPGLTTIHLAEMVANVPYLVMEYIDGPSLARILKSRGRLGLTPALAVLEMVTDALGALHEQGIIHQDIKPANVLLDLDGQAYLTDFGLTHARSALQSTDFAACVAGTPPYMAPEVFEGHITVRADVYALGIMAFELLCGELPYASTPAELHTQHRGTPLPVERLEQYSLDADLISVLERATHKDAMFRHKTARHFLRALHEACPKMPGPAVGARKLADLVTQCRHDTATETPRPDGEATPTSYYKTIAARAAAKRGDKTPSSTTNAVEDGSPPREARENRATLAFDIPCVRCQYNLRGLAAKGKCPECGEPIANSLRPERLLFADRRWLGRVLRGQTIILVSVGAFILGLAAYILISGLVPWRTGEEGLPAAFIVWECFGLLAALLLTVGAWLSVGAKHAGHLSPGQRIGSILARAATILFFLVVCLHETRYLAHEVKEELPAFNAICLAIKPFWLVLMLAAPIGVFIFLQGVARRVPNVRVARDMRIAAVLFGLWALVLLTFPLGVGDILPTVWVTIAYLVSFPLYFIGLAWVTWRARRMLQDVMRVLVPKGTALVENRPDSGTPRS
ncbi:MAG: serine/threonine protein kinase, partial [Phycisphaerae bacterium]|nr:serine/threonine protein kinase [Phycisphaerae bacterium]